MIAPLRSDGPPLDAGAWTAVLTLAFAACLAGLVICWKARDRAIDDGRRFAATALAAVFAIGLVVVLVAAGLSFVARQAED